MNWLLNWCRNVVKLFGQPVFNPFFDNVRKRSIPLSVFRVTMAGFVELQEDEEKRLEKVSSLDPSTCTLLTCLYSCSANFFLQFIYNDACYAITVTCARRFVRCIRS